MQAIIDTYLNVKNTFQSYGVVYSCIYSSTLLLFALWALPEKKAGWEKLYRFSIALFVFILLVSLFAIIHRTATEKEFLTELSDLYMLFPAVLLLILMCVDIGTDLNISSKKIALAFLIIVLCEASVPLRISALDSFTTPSSDGKYSGDIKKIVSIIEDDSVLLPQHIEYAFYSYSIEHGYNPTYMLYDAGEDYLIRSDFDSIFKLSIENGTIYAILRVKEQVGQSNLFDIKVSALKYHYDYITSIGDYAVFKKEALQQ